MTNTLLAAVFDKIKHKEMHTPELLALITFPDLFCSP
jgi:hypothetical protein